METEFTDEDIGLSESDPELLAIAVASVVIFCMVASVGVGCILSVVYHWFFN